jgi:hypothetical protein
MIKKVLFIWVAVLAISVACKKDCVTYFDYTVNSFRFSPNSENAGLFSSETQNSGDTIRSVRNQFYFNPDKEFAALQVPVLESFCIFNSAYAKDDCAEIERSLTSFDPLKTVFSVDAPIDLSAFGLVGVIPADANLLSFQEFRDLYLFDIQNNAEMHNGLGSPVNVSKDFLKYFNGQTRTFKLQLTTPTGNILSNTATVVLDINA